MGNDLFETLLYLCSGGQAWDAKLPAGAQIVAGSGKLTVIVLPYILQGNLLIIMMIMCCISAYCQWSVRLCQCFANPGPAKIRLLLIVAAIVQG